jgi:HlyD family secretion protein
VRDLLVREGAQVTAEDVLIRLDDTQARASLVIVNSNLAELYARQARLEAERDGAETIDFGPLSAVALPGGTEKIIQAEQKLFELPGRRVPGRSRSSTNAVGRCRRKSRV